MFLPLDPIEVIMVATIAVAGIIMWRAVTASHAERRAGANLGRRAKPEVEAEASGAQGSEPLEQGRVFSRDKRRATWEAHGSAPLALSSSGSLRSRARGDRLAEVRAAASP